MSQDRPRKSSGLTAFFTAARSYRAKRTLPHFGQTPYTASALNSAPQPVHCRLRRWLVGFDADGDLATASKIASARVAHCRRVAQPARASRPRPPVKGRRAVIKREAASKPPLLTRMVSLAAGHCCFGRRRQAELPKHPKPVLDSPVLGDLAVGHLDEVCLRPLRVLSGCGHPKRLTLVGAAD